MPENTTTKAETVNTGLELQINNIRTTLTQHPETPFVQQLASLTPLKTPEHLDAFLRQHASADITSELCSNLLQQPVTKNTICSCGLFGTSEPGFRPAQYPERWRDPGQTVVTNADGENAIGVVVPSIYPDTFIYIAGDHNQENFRGFIPAFIITNPCQVSANPV